jgi:hypothetical protein
LLISRAAAQILRDIAKEAGQIVALLRGHIMKGAPKDVLGGGAACRSQRNQRHAPVGVALAAVDKAVGPHALHGLRHCRELAVGLRGDLADAEPSPLAQRHHHAPRRQVEAASVERRSDRDSIIVDYLHE